jgi:hypothetical protein
MDEEDANTIMSRYVGWICIVIFLFIILFAALEDLTS